MNSIIKGTIIFMALLLVLSSVRVSAPFLGYLLFRDSYLYECQVVNHHDSQCLGRCVLNRHLAQEGRENNSEPGSIVHKPVKGVDLILTEVADVQSITEVSDQEFLEYSSCLLSNFPDIKTPPPKILSL